jgi:hypothetical protein
MLPERARRMNNRIFLFNAVSEVPQDLFNIGVGQHMNQIFRPD